MPYLYFNLFKFISNNCRLLFGPEYALRWRSILCDIMEETSIQNAVQQVIFTWGRLDVAVANAGFGVVGGIDKLTAADWIRQLQVNVTGLALTIKYALPHLKQNNGRIGLVGSVGAYVPNPNIWAYGTSNLR